MMGAYLRVLPAFSTFHSLSVSLFPFDLRFFYSVPNKQTKLPFFPLFFSHSPRNPVRRVDPSTLAFSLSSHRHSKQSLPMYVLELVQKKGLDLFDIQHLERV